MKKLLLGSALLILFSCSIILFQLSCRKEATARNMSDETPAVMLISKNIETKFREQTGVDSLRNPVFDERWFSYIELYILKDNKAAPVKININLPPDEYPVLNACLSKDGNKIFFSTQHKTKGYSGIYSCNINGSDAQKVADENYFLQDVK